MGDISEMILEGFMCEGCGCIMEDEDSPGYPRRCADCKKEERDEKREYKKGRKRGKRKKTNKEG